MVCASAWLCVSREREGTGSGGGLHHSTLFSGSWYHQAIFFPHFETCRARRSRSDCEEQEILKEASFEDLPFRPDSEMHIMMVEAVAFLEAVVDQAIGVVGASGDRLIAVIPLPRPSFVALYCTCLLARCPRPLSEGTCASALHRPWNHAGWFMLVVGAPKFVGLLFLFPSLSHTVAIPHPLPCS